MMAGSIKLLSSSSRRLFWSPQPQIQSCRSSLAFICNSYATRTGGQRQKPKIKGPRKNAQYPFIPGDPPYHEKLISKIEKEKLSLKKMKSTPMTIVSREITSNGIHNADQNRFKSGAKPVIHDDVQRFSQYGHPFKRLKENSLLLGRTILKAKSSSDNETILLEGVRLIRDSVILGAELKYLYFSDESVLKDIPPSLLGEAEIFKILYRDMKTWSDTTTPCGILGVFKKPGQGEVCTSKGPFLPFTVILDQIKDPGNVGTLIRTAAAVGCHQVLVMKGCADVWERKVLRSGMCGHFAVPIFNGLSWSDVYSYVHNDTQVFLADARTESDLKKELHHSPVTQQAEYDSSSDSEASSSDSESDIEDFESTDSITMRSTAEDHHISNQIPFPVISYSNLILHTSCGSSEEIKDVALVIGNETKGLSASAKRFAYTSYGTFVTVPMTETIDSLNTSVAGSIIMYELRRKLLELQNTIKDK